MQASGWGVRLGSLIRCRESGGIPRRVRGGAAGLSSVDQQSREKHKWRWRKHGHLGGQERQRTGLHPHSHRPRRGLPETRALGTKALGPQALTP